MRYLTSFAVGAARVEMHTPTRELRRLPTLLRSKHKVVLGQRLTEVHMSSSQVSRSAARSVMFDCDVDRTSLLVLGSAIHRSKARAAFSFGGPASCIVQDISAVPSQRKTSWILFAPEQLQGCVRTTTESAWHVTIR